MKQTTFYLPDDDAEKIPRSMNVSAYVRTLIRLLVWSQSKCWSEFDKGGEFHDCVKSIHENYVEKIGKRMY